MKTIFLLVLQFVVFASRANRYYFSSTSGDDSRSPMQARNAQTPWKTLDKLNSYFSQLKPGDSVLLKRGDSFPGFLLINGSGSNTAPIVVSAYGSGSKPVITGLSRLSNWKQEASGIWSSSLPTPSNTVNLLIINDSVEAMGRYPNADEGLSGYRTISDHSGKNSITDNSLTGNINWTGAELVIRKNRFIIDRSRITQTDGGSISYQGGSFYEPTNKFGYFIQDHLQTLDRNGEWYFNRSLKKMFLYNSTGNPAAMRISASTRDTLIAGKNIQYVILDNLCLMGANNTAIAIAGSNHITISQCDIQYSGADAISVSESNHILIDTNQIRQTNNDAIVITGTENRIINNRISNTGIRPGMGANENSYISISLIGDGNLIGKNEIINSGYHPIVFLGNRDTIMANLISGFNLIKDDGGGIYTWSGKLSQNANQEGRLILGNFISNGHEATAGTDGAKGIAAGIYLDDNSAGVNVSGNTVTNCVFGLYLHNAHEIAADNNILYGNEIQLYLKHDQGKFEMKNNFLRRNYLISTDKKQLLAQVFYTDDNMGRYAEVDSNCYVYPSTNEKPFATFSRKRLIPLSFYSFDAWRDNFQLDRYSKTMDTSNVSVKTNLSENVITVSLGTFYSDRINSTNGNNLVLQPRQSAVLFKKIPR